MQEDLTGQEKREGCCIGTGSTYSRGKSKKALLYWLVLGNTWLWFDFHLDYLLTKRYTTKKYTEHNSFSLIKAWFYYTGLFCCHSMLLSLPNLIEIIRPLHLNKLTNKKGMRTEGSYSEYCMMNKKHFSKTNGKTKKTKNKTLPNKSFQEEISSMFHIHP